MAASERHEGAFHEFVALRSSRLFGTALLLVGDYQLAQDLLQESLIKTYTAWPRLRDVGNAEAYTRRIIVTTSISWRRRRSFHERPAEALPERVVADAADLVAADADLWSQLRLLPPRQRAAVVLRYCQDLSEVQTSELMGCTVSSVKRHASRGLAKLRDQMGPRFDLTSPEDSAVTS